MQNLLQDPASNQLEDHAEGAEWAQHHLLVVALHWWSGPFPAVQHSLDPTSCQWRSLVASCSLVPRCVMLQTFWCFILVGMRHISADIGRGYQRANSYNLKRAAHVQLWGWHIWWHSFVLNDIMTTTFFTLCLSSRCLGILQRAQAKPVCRRWLVRWLNRMQRASQADAVDGILNFGHSEGIWQECRVRVGCPIYNSCNSCDVSEPKKQIN